MLEFLFPKKFYCKRKEEITGMGMNIVKWCFSVQCFKVLLLVLLVLFFVI